MTNSGSNYTALTRFLGSHPEILALQRFRELQIRNLLFYQAELAHLQQELAELEDADVGPVNQRANHRWTPDMAQAYGPLDPAQSVPLSSRPYCEKMLQIRSTLASYNDAVEQYKRLSDIRCPSRADIAAVCDWLNKSTRAAAFLAGNVEDVWNVLQISGKRAPASPDNFYGFGDDNGIAYRLGTILAAFHQFLPGSDDPDRAYGMDTTTSGALARTISTIVASVLPIIPIIVFYFVERLIVRIGLIVAFTAAFAAFLVIGLQLSPDTTLGITTAIAAIQVVYVGTTAPSASS